MARTGSVVTQTDGGIPERPERRDWAGGGDAGGGYRRAAGADSAGARGQSEHVRSRLAERSAAVKYPVCTCTRTGCGIC